VDKEKNAKRQVTELLRSSDQAWLSSSLNVMPQIGEDGKSDFRPEGERGSQLLGAISQGRFDSYFVGKDSPLLAKDEAKTDEKADATEDNPVVSGVIEHSPESARIILLASNDFLNDQVVQMLGSSNGSQYLGGLQLMANTVDWSTEEQGLLSIRSRGHFNRTLPPMDQDEQMFWESANYVMAVLLLGMLALWQTYQRRQRSRRYSQSFAT
jgi:ABC-2 type transport system permease protein